MPVNHLKALDDISNCRTLALGGHLDRCDYCGYTHLFYHSCYNRSCPKCQGIHSLKWLEKRETEVLPVNYFHVVFTIPKEIHAIVRSNPTELLDVLIKAAAYSLIKIMADPKYGGGQPGLLCILHTWTRIMGYHPHVHCLVPAVVVTNTNAHNAHNAHQLQWRIIEKKFLVPVKALSDIFRAKFVKMARKKLLTPKNYQFPQSIWKKRWVVFCKPSIQKRKPGQKVIHLLQYLSRYVHRIAITNSRILSDNNSNISFKYQECNQGKWKKLTLSAMEFMRRFLQHVLPVGFHKIRYYGFLSPSRRDIFRLLKVALESSSKSSPQYHTQISTTDDNLQKSVASNYCNKCPNCKIGKMVLIQHFFWGKNNYLGSRPPP